MPKATAIQYVSGKKLSFIFKNMLLKKGLPRFEQRENHLVNLRNSLLKIIPLGFIQITMVNINRFVGADQVSKASSWI